MMNRDFLMEITSCVEIIYSEKGGNQMKVLFGSGGETACFDDGDQQIPELNRSWILLYAEYLVREGIDPTKVVFEMPGSMFKAEVFKTKYGFNWRLI